MKVIRLAIRSILHFRMYSVVNLLGLALSLACVITIFRYVYGELTVDRFNKNLERVYVTTYESSTSPGEVYLTGIPERDEKFADLIQHPGVEMFSHFIFYQRGRIEVDDCKYTASIMLADSNFLKITGYSVISGVGNLSKPHDALITESYAHKIFGNENPVGKTIQHSLTGEIQTVTVTGILGPISTKTTLSFDIMLSYQLSDDIRFRPTANTFVLLYPGVDYRAINKQYGTFVEERSSWDSQARSQLFPLSKAYFDKSITNHFFLFNHRGNYSYVTVLMAVGILLMLAGIINYINVYTVVVLRRGRELGIKKVFGAAGHNIFLQLHVENLLMTGLALMAAFILVGVASPLITNVLQLGQMANIRFDIFLSCVMLFSLPAITTLYPFLRHHYSVTVNSLRSFDKIRGGSLRHVFLSFQYVITIALIVVSLFFVKQLRFMLNTDPGYRTKDIVKVEYLRESHRLLSPMSDEEWQTKQERDERLFDEIVQRINVCPLFSFPTFCSISPNKFSDGRGNMFKYQEGEYKRINVVYVNERWFRLFDIQLKEGRLWDDEKDDISQYNLIVTESVLKLYGITDFNEAFLQPEIPTDGDKEMETNPPFRIVGVVKDFDYLHLSKKSGPLVFRYWEGYKYSDLMTSIVPGRTQEAIEFLRNLHEETVGGEFLYSFVEDEVRAMYVEDKKIATIYTIFTFIAIFVSALGLFSMSLFDIQQRRKEIAIRKINGATIMDIIRLLLKKFFLSLFVSFAIAAPVALFAIHRYLEDFAHKAPVSWWLFAAAVTLTAAISLLTLIYQTQKAANQNPADVIKTE